MVSKEWQNEHNGIAAGTAIQTCSGCVIAITDRTLSARTSDAGEPVVFRCLDTVRVPPNPMLPHSIAMLCGFGMATPNGNREENCPRPDIWRVGIQVPAKCIYT